MGVTPVLRSVRRKLREKVTETAQNSVKAENREATLVPRLYKASTEREMQDISKVLQ